MSGNPKKIIAYNYFGGKFTYLQYLYANFPAGFEHLDLFGGSFSVSLNYKGRCIRTANEINSKREVISMLTRLRNRKRYVEFEKFFGAFEHTTSGAIDALLNKYKLVLRPSDLFIPDFPKDAIDIMRKYEATTVELCQLKPVFYVIAEESDFKEKDKKRDPILLAQSPFGVYYDILGAWDKEMLLLSEL